MMKIQHERQWVLFEKSVHIYAFINTVNKSFLQVFVSKISCLVSVESLSDQVRNLNITGFMILLESTDCTKCKCNKKCKEIKSELKMNLRLPNANFSLTIHTNFQSQIYINLPVPK